MPRRAPAALTVLVTGGSGFIGSHVVDKLLAAGRRPRIYDQRRSPHHAEGSVETVVGDLGDLRALRRADIGRVVYASTIWVSSDTPATCHLEDLALYPPAHLYTATKLAGEHYCHSYRELYGL